MSTTQNQSPEEYDIVILGSRKGGTVAAWTFAGQGQRVAVVERSTARKLLRISAEVTSLESLNETSSRYRDWRLDCVAPSTETFPHLLFEVSTSPCDSSLHCAVRHPQTICRFSNA
jgi:choline dehydrogenase-like flavoprotein